MTAPTEYRVRIEFDDDMDWSWLEQPEWSDTEPEDLRAVVVVTERECPTCGHFEFLGALHGVTFLEESTSIVDGSFSLDDLKRRAAGDADWSYVLSIVGDELAEAL